MISTKVLLACAVLLVPALAVILHNVFLLAGLGGEAPPSDYGSGAMFDKIAGRYDLVNRILAIGMDVGWRKRMVQAIKDSLPDELEAAAAATDNEKGNNPNPPRPRILDLATGTADVALLLAKGIPHATVVGVDPSSKMLNVGRRKVKEQNLESTVSLRIADAQRLPADELPDSSFDAATMAFGIRNVPDRAMALCQVNRVLKPGSRFCILELSEPDDSFGALGKLARLFIRHVVPFLGSVLSGAPREYWHLQNSIKDFPAPREFGEQLSSINCDASDSSSSPSFDLEDIVQMNFGSVQLYVLKSNKPETLPQPQQ